MAIYNRENAYAALPQLEKKIKELEKEIEKLKKRVKELETQ